MATPNFTIEQLEDGSIDVAAFNHEAHVYIAWRYLERLPLADAIARLTRALKRLTASLGVPDKYHETISWFFMIVVAERRQQPGGDDWESFRANNRDLLSDSKTLLSKYYDDAVLQTEQARRSFLLPQGASTI